jgi:branched-chain amino acid transport system substrate-binding protein
MRTLVKRVSLAWTGLCLAAGLCAAPPALAQGVSDKEILIGMNISLQGGKNAYGVAAGQGMKLMFDAVNASGGVNGRRIVARVLDDDGKADKAEANARQLAKEGVFLLFSSIDGGPSTAVMKVANETKVPFFGPMAGGPTLRRPHQPLVFPVRAEHRDEFRALMAWGKSTGLSSVGFLHADSSVGKLHLENVRLIAQELGMKVVLNIPFAGDTSDAQLDGWVKDIGTAQPDMFINHGSAGLYQRLVQASRAAQLKTQFMGVNSGSSQIVKGLGPLAQGMVFAQVVPSPWARKLAIARDYQDASRKADPQGEFSYGAMEGYMTAKALVMSLQNAGRDLNRARWMAVLEKSRLDLGGLTMQFLPGNHEGLRHVDLSMVSRDGRFLH